MEVPNFLKKVLSSLRVLMQHEGDTKEKLRKRILDLERLALNREDAMEHYVEQAS